MDAGVEKVHSEACLLILVLSMPAALIHWPSHVEVKSACNELQAYSFSLMTPAPSLFPTGTDKSLGLPLMGQSKIT